MELVEGPTLAERLAAGAHPVNDALPIAARIAEALEAAHGRGVIHRDLKPANIKFAASGAVKILDFGIGKAIAADDAATLEAPTFEATRVGTVIGTAAYMSPEQARGLDVDTRTDIWAFGVILFEMLKGRHAFDGATTSDVIAAVLTADPDWSALPAAVPAGVVRLLQRCLERDPGRRLSTIGAARYAIEDLPSDRPSRAALPLERGTHTLRSPWGISTAFVVGAAAMFLVVRALDFGPPPAGPAAPPAILGMSEPPGEPLYLFAGPIALSRDGSRVALVTNSADGKPHVWLRALAAMAPELLRGADGGMYPFWSPDGRALGFFADGQLKIADLASGAIRNLTSWSGPIGGGTWNEDGIIVFADASGLRRVSAANGASASVTSAGLSTSAYHEAPDF